MGLQTEGSLLTTKGEHCSLANGTFAGKLSIKSTIELADMPPYKSFEKCNSENMYYPML